MSVKKSIRGSADVIKKYSKSTSFYKKIKADFFSENDQHLQHALELNKLYTSQPKRENCKLCQQLLGLEPDFISHEVPYVFCSECGHLNGCFDDTESFIDNLYISENGRDYSINYIDDMYKKRTMEIYIPKIEFLLNSIPPHKQYSILDIGCGAGYFVYASHLKDQVVEGIDVSRQMVAFGNTQISMLTGKNLLTHTSETDFFQYVIDTESDIISAIGVIEHLREPLKFFEAFKRSQAKYLFYSVPMFSLSVALESIFKDIFPRQLSGGHTHLFTESSITAMNKIMGATALAEWRFGTDIMDLYRSIYTSLQYNNVSDRFLEYLEQGFASKIDEVQGILDKNHFCSEIHCLIEKSKLV